MPFRARTAVAIFPLLAGCSLLFSDDDITGAGTGLEAGVTPQQDDGGHDGGGGDASDAAPAIDAGCDATFCDDFERLPFAALWDSVMESSGTVRLADAGNASLFSARVVLPKDPAGGHFGLLKKRFVGVKGIACSMAIRPVAISDRVFSLDLEGVAPEVRRWDIVFDVHKTETRLSVAATYTDGGDSPYDAPTAPALALNRWTVVTVSTDLTNAQLWLDGVKVVDHALPVPVSRSNVDMSVGAWTYSNPADDEFLIDDVRCGVTE